VNLRIKLFGFPDLKRLMGGNELTVKIDGGTFGDLLGHLEKTYGQPLKKALIGAGGEVDSSVQVLHNEREWISRDDLSHPLNDGDLVTFILMVAGGQDIDYCSNLKSETISKFECAKFKTKLTGQQK
jgi:molybdopterin converting factor small subunit